MAQPDPAARPSTDQAASAVRNVDVETAHARFLSGALLLDVREPEEWEAGHVEGTTHAPLGGLDAGAYPAHREILTLCRSGGRSSKAASALAGAGKNVIIVEGGITAWLRLDTRL